MLVTNHMEVNKQPEQKYAATLSKEEPGKKVQEEKRNTGEIEWVILIMTI